MITEIQIENLKCGGCASTITKGLLDVKGVEKVTVDVEKSIVTVTTTSPNFDEIKQKLAKLGYPETGSKNTVLHKAKSYVSCAIGKIDV